MPFERLADSAECTTGVTAGLVKDKMLKSEGPPLFPGWELGVGSDIPITGTILVPAEHSLRPFLSL